MSSDICPSLSSDKHACDVELGGVSCEKLDNGATRTEAAASSGTDQTSPLTPLRQTVRGDEKKLLIASTGSNYHTVPIQLVVNSHRPTRRNSTVASSRAV